MKKSQCEQIVEYMKKHGSIMPKEAERHIGCMRLASRICDLRAKGYAINVESVKVKTRNGKRTSVARYSLAEAENADNRCKSSRA